MGRFLIVPALLAAFLLSPFYARAEDTTEQNRDDIVLKGAERVHPYLWHGAGVAGMGGLLLILGVTFNALADREYDTYRDMLTDERITAAINAGEKKETYLTRVNDHLNEGKEYAATRTALYISGGILALTGSVLMLLTEEKRDDTAKFTASFDSNGVYAALSLSF
ncbi:MAG TPA: hypothetical protein PKH10_11110 [bacterium]|nr:hypothetical protein [bacterium]